MIASSENSQVTEARSTDFLNLRERRAQDAAHPVESFGTCSSSPLGEGVDCRYGPQPPAEEHVVSVACRCSSQVLPHRLTTEEVWLQFSSRILRCSEGSFQQWSHRQCNLPGRSVAWARHLLQFAQGLAFSLRSTSVWRISHCKSSGD